MKTRLDSPAGGFGARLAAALRAGAMRLGLALAALVFIASALLVGLLAAVVLVPWWLLRGRRIAGSLRFGHAGGLRRPPPVRPPDAPRDVADVVDVEVREVRDP